MLNIAIVLNELVHECNDISNEIDIPEVINNNILSKRQIKSSIQEAIIEQNRNSMLSLKKVADRLSANSSEYNYLDRLGLSHTGIWIKKVT